MSKMVTATQIAKEMDLPPKRVRAILRKLEYAHDGRWRFAASEKTSIKNAIRDARKRPKAKVAAKPKKSAAKRRVRRPEQAVEASAAIH